MAPRYRNRWRPGDSSSGCEVGPCPLEVDVPLSSISLNPAISEVDVVNVAGRQREARGKSVSRVDGSLSVEVPLRQLAAFWCWPHSYPTRSNSPKMCRPCPYPGLSPASSSSLDWGADSHRRHYVGLDPFSPLSHSSQSKILPKFSPTLEEHLNKLTSSTGVGVASNSPVEVRTTPFMAEGKESICMGREIGVSFEAL